MTSTPQIQLKILIVDDEPEIRSFLSAALGSEGYAVDYAETGEEALKFVAAKPPDLVILDLGLPDKDGQEVLAQIREWSAVPIIVLSARDRESEKVEALEKGADDYLTKPFGTAELFARLKVALRHANQTSNLVGPAYEQAGLKVDLDQRLVTLNNIPVHLTPTEYKLLATLAKYPGKVITQTTLINEVWGKNSQGNSHYLRIYIQHLRNKLNDDPLDPTYILTEAGIGYRLKWSEAL
jgi:two-component system KDP operon response regulator KdpE